MGSPKAALPAFNSKATEYHSGAEFNRLHSVPVPDELGRQTAPGKGASSVVAQINLGSRKPVSWDMAHQVRLLAKDRRDRAQYFSKNLFADPAWDILLDLTRGDLECQRISISSLCVAAQVPLTTALRWIKTLTANGMVQRRPDPLDRRRVFIELTPSARESMLQYLESYFRSITPDAPRLGSRGAG